MEEDVQEQPQAVGDIMTVGNKHVDMEEAERAHRRHKTKNDYSEYPPRRDNSSERRREDCPPHHGKKHNRAESS